MNNLFIYLFLNMILTGSIIQCSQTTIENPPTAQPGPSPSLSTSEQFRQEHKARERACLTRLALERDKKRKGKEQNT